MRRNYVNSTIVTNTIIDTIIEIVPNNIKDDHDNFVITWPVNEGTKLTIDKSSMKIIIEFNGEQFIIDPLDPSIDIDYLPFSESTVDPWSLIDSIFFGLTGKFLDDDLLRLRKDIDGQN